MKFTITMKDPDGPFDCIREAAEEAVKAIEGLDDDERKAVIESKHDKFREICSKWMRWGEYLNFEIDTEAQTIRVLEATNDTQTLAKAHADWEKRNDVMLVALNSERKIVAAGWFNLDHAPSREEKTEAKSFYRESAGYEVKILRGEEINAFKKMEWVR